MASLILDTTGDNAFLAWADRGSVISQTILVEGRQLSKTLLPSIDSLLQGTTPDYIAIGIGPGSFTGSRVGAMVAQTLSYAWKIPFISFDSSLLPDLEKIASLTYQEFILGKFTSQIELVYISPSP